MRNEKCGIRNVGIGNNSKNAKGMGKKYSKTFCDSRFLLFFAWRLSLFDKQQRLSRLYNENF